MFMGILDTIIASKRKNVARLRKSQGQFVAHERNNPRRSLVESLRMPGSTGIIAEFKRKSPSKGWFKPGDTDPVQIVKAYNDLGAAGISVLTDQEFFGGHPDDLVLTRKNTTVPVLRKDFIIDPSQVTESAEMGADVILLIAACLSCHEVKNLAGFARSLGLEVLLEIHNEGELDHICEEVDLVGVNNRNLDTFEVNIGTSLALIGKLPTGKPAIAESGISDVESIVTLKEAGFSGFLIGENFMKQADPAIAFADFVKQLKSKGA